VNFGLIGQNLEENVHGILKLNNDIKRLDSLHKLTNIEVRKNTDSGRFVADFYLEEANKSKDPDYIGKALHLLGVSYAWQGQYDKAMEYYNLSLDQFQINGDDNNLALIFTSIGGVYFDQNKHLKNLDYWLLAKAHAKKANNPQRTESCNNNLAVLYMQIGKSDEAKKMFEENLKLAKKNDWPISVALSYINLTDFYLKENDLETAEEFTREAYRIYIEHEQERQIATTVQNLAEIEFRKGDQDEGLRLVLEAIELWKRQKDDFNLNSTKVYLGHKYLLMNKPLKALKNCLEAYNESLNIESLGLQQESCKCLAQAYYKTRNYKKAYDFDLLYRSLKDSIMNSDVSTDLIRKEFEFDYKLKLEKDSLNQAKADEIQRIEHDNELQNQRYFTYFGLLLAGIATILSLYVFRNLKRKKRDHEKILLSKQIIETKNKEITDSINYAKRIQTAMLPRESLCKKILPNHFILYKPKDIVAGDFYWFQEYKNKKYFAVADCTGHGVPGAMMSVICNNALNRSLNEFNITEPGQILDKTKAIIIEELNDGESPDSDARSIKDGMDISLVCIDRNTDGTINMSFAGAYNSVFIIRKSNVEDSESYNIKQFDDLQLIELKGDKQPVGLGISKHDFTTKTISLKNNDRLYMFSDGYADQFGNNVNGFEEGGLTVKPQGKKYKSSNLKKLLVSISQKELREQKQILEDNFENWKGDIEQLDDVCLIGVKI
jgi:serine phosphatase RsbU (regulator of sigma subunit)